MVKYIPFSDRAYCDLCNRGIYEVSKPLSQQMPTDATHTYSTVIENKTGTVWAFPVYEDDALLVNEASDFAVLRQMFAVLKDCGAMTQQEEDIILANLEAHKGTIADILSFLPAYTISVMKTWDELKAMGFFPDKE